MLVIGSGLPFLLLPGIHGRWEWHRPTAEALGRRFRVVTFSLCGDRASGWPIDPIVGFDCHLAQIDARLDQAGVAQPIVIGGISYGGLAALRYAAMRPARVGALVLASTPAPSWRPEPWVRRWAGWPRLYAPAFGLMAVRRMWPELLATFRSPGAALRFMARHAIRIGLAPMSTRAMGQRVHLLDGCDFVADARRINVPTLVTTGEPGLDRVVPVAGTREYVELIPGARHVTIAGTGHVGVVSRADHFATIVGEFVDQIGGSPVPDRRQSIPP